MKISFLRITANYEAIAGILSKLPGKILVLATPTIEAISLCQEIISNSPAVEILATKELRISQESSKLPPRKPNNGWILPEHTDEAAIWDEIVTIRRYILQKARTHGEDTIVILPECIIDLVSASLRNNVQNLQMLLLVPQLHLDRIGVVLTVEGHQVAVEEVRVERWPGEHNPCM